ncbi:DNA primase [Streptomyces sp. NPDC005931]|uniref:DNA primase n=1 Tax=Streptomyces sp. NPDC005931 TaxID=3364737 RepID=UPI0036B1B3C5
MNRMGLGLAIGAGYLLGRTRKLKMAMAVGGMVAGKKLNISPKMVADLVSQQLRNNPQFKEIGDQLRGDLRGVGKAASGALVERQLDSLADRLHGRTTAMRDQLNGVVRGGRDEGDQDTEEPEEREEADREPQGGPDEDEREESRKPAAKKTPPKEAAAGLARKATSAKKPPAKKAAGRKPAAKRTAAGKSAGSRDGGSRSRSSKGGGES